MSVRTSTYRKTSFPQFVYCRKCERRMLCTSDGDMDEFLMMDSNLCFKLLLQFISVTLPVITCKV